MDVVKTIDGVRAKVSQAKRDNRLVGFVPTMGYLHRGHISLVEESKKQTQYQVMSIFVNKTQFNNPVDFNTYPRNIENDLRLAESAGVDLVFVPDDGEMYRENLTTVRLNLLTDNLCGAHRPGHFDGVFLVVSKLFNIIQPNLAVFGQKDIQQAVSIRKMALDLNFPLKIIISPTVREDDGLAMSSRNKHLSSGERGRALQIFKSLQMAEELLLSGEREGDIIIKECIDILKKGEPDNTDYFSLVNFSDLSYIDTVGDKSVIAVAAYFGKTRLIDNMIIEIDGGSVKCVY